MSDMQINAILQQIRAVSNTIDGASPMAEQEVEHTDFSQLLSRSLNQVNSVQQEASQTAEAFELGQDGVDIPQVMVALEKASLSFEAMKQVRNKLVSAYQEIMSMGV